jgi:hypothetical protein
VLVCAVTERVWEAGAAALVTAVNEKVEELSVSVPEAAVTLRVTLTVCVAAEVAMEMVPVQVVPEAIPA